MLTSSHSLRRLSTSNKIQLLLSVLWRCLVGTPISWTINPYLRLLSVLIHSIPACSGKPKPAANQNVSQPFTEQCKLQFLGCSKTLSQCFWAERWLLPAVLERRTWFSISVFHAALASLFFSTREKEWVCVCVISFRRSNYGNSDSMWCVFGDISVMGSVYAAFIACILRKKKLL